MFRIQGLNGSSQPSHNRSLEVITMMSTNSSSVVLDAQMAADSALRALREAIFWDVACRTAYHRELDEIFSSMKEVADAAVSASTADLFCNDRLVETIRFDSDDPLRQILSLRHLYRVLLARGCWFEDSCGEGIASFCWQCARDYYQIIFK